MIKCILVIWTVSPHLENAECSQLLTQTGEETIHILPAKHSAVRRLYPVIIGCWDSAAHAFLRQIHGGMEEKGHSWNNINGMEM